MSPANAGLSFKHLDLLVRLFVTRSETGHVVCRSILSRTALVSDLSSKGVVNLVSDEVKQIYSLLEADFTPLELCQKLAPLLEQLETVTKSMSGGCLETSVILPSRFIRECSA